MRCCRLCGTTPIKTFSDHGPRFCNCGNPSCPMFHVVVDPDTWNAINLPVAIMPGANETVAYTMERAAHAVGFPLATSMAQFLAAVAIKSITEGAIR